MAAHKSNGSIYRPTAVTTSERVATAQPETVVGRWMRVVEENAVEYGEKVAGEQGKGFIRSLFR
jgi:hypothetical protein